MAAVRAPDRDEQALTGSRADPSASQNSGRVVASGQAMMEPDTKYRNKRKETQF